MFITPVSVLSRQILAGQIECDQLKNMDASPLFGLTTDKSTDISVTKQVVLYKRYTKRRVIPAALVLCIIDLVDGTAVRIEDAIKAYLSEKGLPFSKLMGFTSDGAADMTGRVFQV